MFNGLPHYLYEIAQQEAELHKEITECHVYFKLLYIVITYHLIFVYLQVMYMRRVGYLLAVKQYPGLSDEGDLPNGLEMKVTLKFIFEPMA